MKRRLSSPNAGSSVVNTINILQGGTSAITSVQARSNINAASTSLLGQPNGIVSLDSKGKLSIQQIDTLLNTVAVFADATEVPLGETISFKINDYNIFSDYTVSCTYGKVYRKDDIIYYEASANVQSDIIVINGRELSLNITETKPNKPIIQFPINNSTNVNTEFTIIASPYSSKSGNTHASTDWEVALDDIFNNIVISSYNNLSNLTTLNIAGLSKETNYYVRVRYRDNEGRLSNWSDIILFKSLYIPYPSLEVKKFYGNIPEVNANFGYSIDISENGKVVTVGAPYASSQSGAVTNYRYDADMDYWDEYDSLSASNAASGNLFGYSVAISANGVNTAVGSPGTLTNKGSAYIFNYNPTLQTSTEVAILTASDGVSGDNFGHSIAISADGTKVAIGAYGDYSSKGSVYIFKYDADIMLWIEDTKLVPMFATAGDKVGFSVDISADGNIVAIGAPGSNSNTGAVYVYRYDANSMLWVDDFVITASNGLSGDQFGYSLSMSNDGNTIIVGTIGRNSGKGAAYIFEYDDNTIIWSESAYIENNTLPINSRLGLDVSINTTKDLIVISSDSYNNSEGAVFIYTYSNSSWNLKKTLQASDKATDDKFGQSVALTPSGSHLIVGSHQDDNSQSNSGTVYLFT